MSYEFHYSVEFCDHTLLTVVCAQNQFDADTEIFWNYPLLTDYQMINQIELDRTCIY